MTRTDFYQSHQSQVQPFINDMEPSNLGLREAVGLFTTSEELQNAVRELEGTEFARHDISVLGGRKEIEAVFGAPAVSPYRAEDNLDTPRQPPVRPEEKTIGASALIGGGIYIGVMAMALAAGPLTIPATIAAIAVGGGSGALVGGSILKLLETNFAKNVEEQLANGGLLLWVNTTDAEKEQLACDILARNGATHVKIHEVL